MVARRGDGAPEREARRDVGVEQRGDRLEDLEADAGVALEQGVDADEHGGARGGRRQPVAVVAGAERAGVEESAAAADRKRANRIRLAPRMQEPLLPLPIIFLLVVILLAWLFCLPDELRWSALPSLVQRWEVAPKPVVTP